jgi:hypothetical protein
MANEVALKFLTDKITALRAISQELTRIYLGLTDLDEADQFRAEVTSVNQLLFALESARNNLEAGSDPIPAPSADRLTALENALRQLDAYVRSDQNIHMALNYLTQVSNLVTSS